jgi:hypothetical protein
MAMKIKVLDVSEERIRHFVKPFCVTQRHGRTLTPAGRIWSASVDKQPRYLPRRGQRGQDEQSPIRRSFSQHRLQEFGQRTTISHVQLPESVREFDGKIVIAAVAVASCFHGLDKPGSERFLSRESRIRNRTANQQSRRPAGQCARR